MKFLFNTVYYKPARGGGGPIYSVSALAEEVVRSGHEVTVVASDLDIPERLNIDCEAAHEVEGVRVRYFRAVPTLLQRTGISMFKRAGVFSFGPEFGRWVSSNASKFDVIHSHIAFTSSNRLCSLSARRHSRIYLYHQRGNLDPVRLKRGWLKKSVYLKVREVPVMRRANALIALTEREVDSFRKLGLKNRVEIIPNGIDVAPFERGSLRPGFRTVSLLEKVGHGPVFLWMSRIHPVKGPDLFVDAFITAARADSTLRAVMAGPDEIGMMSDLVARIRAAGLENRFDYVDLLHGDDKTALLRRADCFVLPTESEGFSMVLLKALANRCAILTTKGASFDQIQTAGAGWILERDSTQFAAGMLRLGRMGRDGMNAMGQNGLDLVRTSYSWQSVGKKYLQLCSELEPGRNGH